MPKSQFYCQRLEFFFSKGDSQNYTLAVGFRLGAQGAWAPNVCMNFGLQFLELVRATFEGSAPAEPGVHIVFDYIPRRRTVSSRRLAAQDMNRPILPDWYTTAMASEPV